MSSRGRANCSLYVRNIPEDTRPDDVRDIFTKFGPIQDVYIPLDYHSRKPRGFAYVQYRDPRDAEDALYELQYGTKVNGMEVQIEWARSDRKTPHEMHLKEKGGRYSRSRSYSPRRRRSPYRGGGGRRRDDYRGERRREKDGYRSRSRSPAPRYSRSRSRTRSPYPRSSLDRDRSTSPPPGKGSRSPRREVVAAE